MEEKREAVQDREKEGRYGWRVEKEFWERVKGRTRQSE